MASSIKRPGSAANVEHVDPSAEYEVLEKIGQGSFGVIRKVRRKGTGEILARKEISYRSMSTREKEQLHAEIKVLERLQHTNIVQYVSRYHVKASNELHLYMEYCSSGDLGGYIKRLERSNRFADEEFVWSVFSQLVGALYRCHAGEDTPAPGRESELNRPKAVQALRRKDEDQIILHRDLKPENVFLTNGSTVKLGDFGLSKLISAHDFASTYVGTPFYMSPEICSSERYSGKSDIWSLGCIIYELCALEPPFNARSHLELIQKIRIGKTKPLPAHFSKELGQVISSCLRINPDERPDTAQLLQVGQIRFARMKLESELAYSRGCTERDAILEKLKRAEKENASLRDEVAKLKNAESHLKMEWHAKATLAIESRVEEEKQKLRSIFEAEVDSRTETKLNAHLASLPAAQGISVSVRSSTPPPESKYSSFATAPTTVSSPERTIDDGDIDTDLTSLSLGDDVSPLAQRTKPLPRKTGRTPFTRAKTVANAYPGSPMDVQMSDRSPMQPNNLRGLALSPRRDGRPREGLLGQAVRRNIFAEAAKLQPTSNFNTASSNDADDADTSFADDLLDDDDEPYSPTRPTSGLSNANGDPFKALGAPSMAPPMRRPGGRPSLERQKTMPVTMPQSSNARRNTLFATNNASNTSLPSLPSLPKSTTMSNLTSGHTNNTRENTKENRPPSSHARTNTVPVLATSPKRTALPQKKELTPSRQAPKAPGNKTPAGAVKKAGDLLRGAQRNALQGRTLVELSQAPGTCGMPVSPVKWEQEMLKGEVGEMPSPFLARKGRQIG